MMVSMFCSLLVPSPSPLAPPTPALTSGDRTRNWPADTQLLPRPGCSYTLTLYNCCGVVVAAAAAAVGPPSPVTRPMPVINHQN